MNKRYYSLLIFIFAFLVSLVTKTKIEASVVLVNDSNERTYGCDAPTNEEIASYNNLIDCSQQSIQTRATLPTSVDLSTSIYFPPVANQHQTGSCAAFAGGYYQFTYERNRVKGVASDADTTWASPTWIYRMYGNHGNSYYVYNILEKYGPLSWADDPYNVDSNDVAIVGTFPNNVSAMISEMEYRIVDRAELYFNTTGTPVTSSSSSVLQPIKQELANGYTLYVSTLARGWVELEDKTTKIHAIVRGGDVLGSGHGVLIVGYDDNFYFDINGNGSKDRGETGAFKIVNSWGTDFANDGFCWVMYDALNTVSYVPNNPWGTDSEHGNRVGIFSRENSENPENGFINSWFYKIAVGKTNCDYMLQLSLNGQHLNWLSLNEQGKLERQNSTTLTTSSLKDLFVMPYVAETLSYSGQWVVDLTVTEESKMQLNSTVDYVDYTIATKLGLADPYTAKERKDNPSLPQLSYLKNVMSSITYKVIDANGTALSTARTRTLGNISSAYLNSIIFLDTRGDVNCDGVANAEDALMVLKHAARTIVLTNLQAYYADYNKDGLVNATDANLILQEAAGLTAAEASAQINAMLNQIYQTSQNETM